MLGAVQSGDAAASHFAGEGQTDPPPKASEDLEWRSSRKQQRVGKQAAALATLCAGGELQF